MSALESSVEFGPLFRLETIVKPLNPNLTASSISYSYQFGFERPFHSHAHVDAIKTWMQANWTYSVLAAALYLTLVFVGRQYMSSRARYELRKPLIAWNVALATFSIVGTIRVWPEFIEAIFGKSLVYSVCDGSVYYGISGFWGFLFGMSKLPELVDTLFIVLRKQVKIL
jgi:elongation of very long chain fatty acids protein 6